MKKTFIALLLSGVSLYAAADPVEIVPVSYVFDAKTDSGAADYADHTGSQLTDGLIHNDEEWIADAGRGRAYDIVGWGEWAEGEGVTFVNIDFTFDALTSFSSLTYGAFTDQGAAIYAPSVNIYAMEQGEWVLKTGLTVTHELRDTTLSTRDEYTLDLDFSAQQVRMEAYRISDAPYREHNWTFIDEVDFYATQSEDIDAGSSATDVSVGHGIGALLMGGLALRLRRRRGVTS